MKVFISYAHEDGEDFANTVVVQLEKRNYEALIDQREIKRLDDWRIKIDDAIRASIAVILILTPASAKSEYVRYEWAFAYGAGKMVIPLLFVETSESDIHPRIRPIQHLDFTTPKNRQWNDLLDKLREAAEQQVNATDKTTAYPPYIEKCLEKLEELNEGVRRKAIDDLVKYDHSMTEVALIEATQHSLSDVVAYASYRLAERTNYQSPEAMQGLLKALQSENDSDRKLAERELPRYGIQILDSVLEVLQHPWIEVRYHAVKVLTALKDGRANPPLLKALEDESKVKQAALEAVSVLKVSEAIDKLITLLEDPSEPYKDRIVEILGNFKAVEAIPSLILILSSSAHGLRIRVANALTQIGEPAVDQLIELLKLKKSSVLTLVTEILGKIRDKRSISQLLTNLHHQSLDVRLSTIRALGLIGDGVVAISLLPLVDDPVDKVREITIWALGEVQATSATTKLIEFLNLEIELERWAAVGALGKIGSREAIPFLRAILQSGEREASQIVFRAVVALGQLRAEEAIPEIQARLVDQSAAFWTEDNLIHQSRVNNAAFNALKEIGTPAALAAIEEFNRRNEEDS